ncbi:retrovirus-related pol polyprotein from transposon TNT 1-94 [Tanacetum coccineum]
MTTAGIRAVVNTGKGKMDNALKKSRWVWRPKRNYMDHESKEKGSFILKKFEAIQRSVYEDYNGGFVAFRSDPKGGRWPFPPQSHQVLLTKRDKRKFSVARTPQQNGVAERKNRTLIEAARTMLADSLLPFPCKPPSISFIRPFGCPLTILNTLDPLGKFDVKSDEGYLLGYSTTSKTFKVYNNRTKRVEENMHIDFFEDQPNVAGSGPDWMF